MTIPIRVAFAERSFLKLKLIKSYLKSTMLQEKLNGLTIVSIEKEMLEKHEYKTWIRNFALQKARRMIFKNLIFN